MELKFLVGCYTSPTHKNGLHVLELDADRGIITLINSHEVANSSYLTFSPNKSIIYTVNENHGISDSLTAIKFDKKALAFETINEIDVKGSDPCFISIDSKGRHVFSANYSDGTLCCVPIQNHGELASSIQVLKHDINPLDSLHPNTHMHAAVLSPDEQFLLASNLGQDTITVYNYQPMNLDKPLSKTKTVYQFPAGTGPRHLIFDELAKFVYIVGELDATLHILAWNNGALSFVQRLMLMPADFKGKNSAADIHFGAGGKFLYVSNRGDANQLICFSINQETGEAVLLARTPSLGHGPRNFAIDSSGKYMLVAHQYSNDIRLFKINEISGELVNLGVSYPINSPVYVSFFS